jgi:hypothetical protein
MSSARQEKLKRLVAGYLEAELTVGRGWLSRLLTHPVKGLENYRELIDTLTTARGAIKVYCEVAA